ncbi:MAG: DUF1631 domain-containing protein [Comamonadaceae bacterium]|nr:MAG: DUF1631 domain-containing protein [Comamonadaceae bacterium]
MAANNKDVSLIARQARELFTERAVRLLPELHRAVKDRILVLVDLPGNAREMQDRRDGWLAYQIKGQVWASGTSKAWKQVVSANVAAEPLRTSSDSGSKFELMDNEVMENRILASRLALRLLDVASWELSDLRLRIQNLENIPELGKDDIFRPEVLARHIVEQWTEASLSRELWMSVQDLIQNLLAQQLLEVYHAANEFLVKKGVMVEIDLRPLVKRTPSAVVPGADTGVGASESAGLSSRSSLRGESSSGSVGPAHAAGLANAHDETRMQTATTPLAKVRMRAQGVMGHLKRLLSDQVAGFDDTRSSSATPALAKALGKVVAAESPSDQTLLAGNGGEVYAEVHVQQAQDVIRKRSASLKQETSSTSEKATIEIVALMFQSILAEDRIPPTIRVWFARLQMPVLRVALAEPEFFGTLQHPARRLIDRMGSCVLGFDVAVTGGAMEIEIKRIVQVIEQYPETGRRVFQLVYDEFEKFLSRFLSEQGSAARVVSVAQQVEQKETMAIQYTIEMRSMLNDMPVREEIREFLFKVWAEVLAIAAMRNGPQHLETTKLKQAAADLVWAASAKPNRDDRARVIADLPKLLQLLRKGMAMLGMESGQQDEHIKVISDTLADAFMSKTDSISMDRINAMAKRLANLEDYLSDEDVGDLPLDTESLVMMIGIDASDIEVITDGGSHPSEAMRAWAQELQLGSWFSLDHNGIVSQVQFAWRSDRRQLHLFASADGRNFLIQARRLAAYLQAGLLAPVEEEALTVRATRDALAKLDANPERLLN